MEIHQLRSFVMLAECLSFTQAARRLHISQPPLSMHIAALEANLGAKLFERTSRSVALTDAGRALLGHAQAVLDRLSEAKAHVQRVGMGQLGRVRVGLSGSHFLGPMPRFLREFKVQCPGVELLLHELQPAAQLQALRSGAIDLCLARMPAHAADLTATKLWADPVAVALPAGHWLALKADPPLALEELAREDFVMLNRASSRFARYSLEACVAAGFAPRVVQEVVEIPALLNLVAAGLGVGLVPSSLALQRGDSVVTRCLEGSSVPAGWSGDVYLLRRANEASPVVLEFEKRLIAGSLYVHP